MLRQWRSSSAGLLLSAVVFATSAPVTAVACDAIAPEFADLLAARWASAFNARDRYALPAMYAADAVLVTPARPEALSMPPDVLGHVSELQAQFRLAAPPQRTLRSGCNTLLDFGELTFVARSQPGKRFPMAYSRLFERRGGHWRITVEHYSSRNGRPPSVARRTFRDRQRLNALARGLSVNGGEAPPEVAGMLIRPPALAPRPETTRRKKTAPRRKRPRKVHQRDPKAWMKRIKGFNYD